MYINVDTASVHVIPMDGVVARVTDIKRGRNGGLRLDYEFQGSGFAIVRIPFKQPVPANYALSFEARGEGLPNNFELKLIDSTGDNVWWVNRPAYTFSPKWQRLSQQKRQFTFAWGPNREELKETSFIEVVISKNEGGSGHVCFANMRWHPLAVDHGNAKVQRVTSTSNRAEAKDVLIAGNYIGWHSSKREKQSLRVDFAGMRALGGVTITWGEDYAVDYDVQMRNGRNAWKTIDSVRNGTGARQLHWLPETELSGLRIRMLKSSRGKGYQMKTLVVQPLNWATTRSEFFMRVAEQSRLGFFPRNLLSQQSYWTVVGNDGAAKKAIINEEGMFEFDVESPSLEPFIFVDGRLLTWAQGKHEHSLADSYLPIPSVVRKHDGVELAITAVADGDTFARPTPYVRYVLKNTSAKQRAGKLFLALRPFQVNPPWQFLNHPGGFTPIHSLKWRSAGKGLLHVGKALTIYSLTPHDGFGATTEKDGGLLSCLENGNLPGSPVIENAEGLASGAIAYVFDLAPGQEMVVDVAALHDGIGMLRSFDRAYADMTTFWKNRLAQVDIDLPGDPVLANTMRSQVAYILINRNKHAIQPGTRCYRRTWIRDGSLTCSALLHWGYNTEVEQFIRWFAAYIYPNGKVPCVVDRRGADPVPENDSHGEFLYLVTEYFRYTKDKQLVEDMFPTMLKVAAYIDELRKSRQTAEFQTEEKRHLYGLVPESISHEGYSAKPAYSYWDDLFCAKGLDDVAWLAAEFSKPEAPALKELANSFQVDFLSSLDRAMAVHQMDVIPGAADLGDFDACSTTIGLDPTNVLYARPDAMARTFERYWKEFQDRRDGRKEWEGYTPYEWRAVGTFLRLGRPDVAHQCAEWFMTHRRPAGWNQWAEAVHKDPLAPRFIGDCPHGWVGSDFLRSARSLFAFEQVFEPEFGADLVFGAGIKPEWLKAGVKINGIRTPQGLINIEAREEDGHLFYNVSGTLRQGIRVQLPEGHKSVTINGKQLSPDFTAGKSWTGLGYCWWLNTPECRTMASGS